MALVKGLMRFFSYVYHGLLALFLLAVSGMAMATDMHSLQLDMLPWKGSSLTYWVFAGAVLGLITVVLAVKRVLPLLFFVWSLVVFVLLVKGYVFSGYYFDAGEFRTAIYLIAGALVAMLGAWYGMKQTSLRA